MGATRAATDIEALHSQPLRHYHGRKRTTDNRSRATPTTNNAKPCSRGGKPSYPRDTCPAKDAICHRRNKKGHDSSQCFSKQVSEVTPNSTQVLDTAFLDAVVGKKESAWFTTIKINGCKLKFKLDTGAEFTAISEQEYKKLNQPPLGPPQSTLNGHSQQPLQTAGQFTGSLRCKSNTITQPVFVVKVLKMNLLGLPAITALRLAVRIDSTVKERFPSVFQGLGNLGEEYEIHLKEGANPYSLFTPRHVPIPLCPKVQAELERMESLGVIRKVDEPTPWCAGMVVVPKKVGAICVDLKPLNDNVL